MKNIFASAIFFNNKNDFVVVDDNRLGLYQFKF